MSKSTEPGDRCVVEGGAGGGGRGMEEGRKFPGLWPGSLCDRWYDIDHGKRSRCRMDDAANPGCVCGTTGTVFCLEMGLRVTWFQEREALPEHLGGRLVLRCGSVGVHSVDCLAEKGQLARAAFLCRAVALGISAAVCVSVSWLRRGATSDLLFADVEGVLTGGAALLSARVSRRLLPGACFYSPGFYDLAI